MDGGVKWIIANWKSNKTLTESIAWVEEVGHKIENRPNLKVVVCPSFVALGEVAHTIKVGHFPLMVGAQNVSRFEGGAHTGEVAATQLVGVASMVMVGHSERRTEEDETDDEIALKIQLAQRVGLMPLLCVPDEEAEIPQGTAMIAYEPIFAIGSGVADTPADAEAKITAIKAKFSNQLPVLYGGSVTSQNAKAFLEQPHIDGLLIGHASLDAEEFVKIIESVYTI